MTDIEHRRRCQMLLVRLVYFEARALYLADEPIIERLGDSADMPDQANDIRSGQMREIGCAKTRSRVERLLPAQHRYSARAGGRDIQRHGVLHVD